MAATDPNDFDALLAEATRTSPAPAKKKDNISYDANEDVEKRFTIASEDRTLSGDYNYRDGKRLELDPESFTNQVEIHSRRKKIKTIALITASTIIVGAFVLFFSQAFFKVESQPAPPTEATQSFLPLYPNAPEANNAQMTLMAEGSMIKTIVGDRLGYKLMMPEELSFTKIDSCKLTQANEFSLCLTTTPEDKFAGVQVWLTKDAVRSGLFAKAENFEPLEVTGAQTAATMTLAGFAAEPRATLTIVTKDSAGYIITLAPKSTLEDAKKLAETITVE